MHHYQTILAAIDFSTHSEQALQRAKQLADIYNAELKVIHVSEVPTYPVLEDVAITGMPGIWDEQLEEKVFKAAHQRLSKLAQQVGVDTDCCSVIVGVARYDIVQHAEEVKADLIVIGRRGLSGLQRLIGSTADAVLHDAQCDVLAVNLEE